MKWDSSKRLQYSWVCWQEFPLKNLQQCKCLYYYSHFHWLWLPGVKKKEKKKEKKIEVFETQRNKLWNSLWYINLVISSSKHFLLTEQYIPLNSRRGKVSSGFIFLWLDLYSQKRPRFVIQFMVSFHNLQEEK